MGPSDDLSLEQLQLKTLVLLAVTSMWRIQSVYWLVTMARCHVNLGQDGKPTNLSLLSKLPKESQAKVSHIGIIQVLNMYPVHTAYMFIQRTRD